MTDTSESVIDEICDHAGTSDADHAVLKAAAALLIGERLRAKAAEARLAELEREIARLKRRDNWADPANWPDETTDSASVSQGEK